GNFSECKKCPRNPFINKISVYAKTCEHFGINKNGLLIIMRDPGGSKGGAASTNFLCPYCNNDRSAIKFRELLKLINIPVTKIYFGNAVLHGIEGKNEREVNKNALNCCKGVLSRLVKILSPKIIFTLGLEALNSSYEILSNGTNIKASVKIIEKNNFYFDIFNSTHLIGMPHISYYLQKGTTNNEFHKIFLKVSRKINKYFKL
ncbi:MAG: uracil-DNA glycosylase family protein, partial [Ignavibacteriaceae bacterium]